MRDNAKRIYTDLPTRITSWIGSPISLIVHTVFFAVAFSLTLFDVPFEDVLLVLTTIVSLEAIYLAIFIQITVNRNTESLYEVEEDIEEIQEDVQEIERDIDEVQEDVEEIQEDVEEIQEEDAEEERDEEKTTVILEDISQRLQVLMNDIEALKKQQR